MTFCKDTILSSQYITVLIYRSLLQSFFLPVIIKSLNFQLELPLMHSNTRTGCRYLDIGHW